MKSFYYLFINAFVISIPLILSFDKNVAFYKKWKAIFSSILIVAIPFILGDVLFTEKGFWGFNSTYLSGVSIFNLPIEEVLFFFTIPYACLFIYASLQHYFKQHISSRFSKIILLLYSFFAFLMIVFYHNNIYSLTTSVFTILIAIYLLKKDKNYISLLSMMNLIAIVPFLFINGILTGTGIENEIVWYSSSAISNIRMLTIPIEDLLYSFNLLSLNVIIYERFKSNNT